MTAQKKTPPKMIVEIVFADNRTEHIEVRDGDDPAQLARAFLGKYKLPASYERVLREQIVASIAEDERQRRLKQPVVQHQVDEDDEGAVSPDDDEEAYNRARQAFSAAETKPRVKRASLVWGKQGATKALPRRQRETCQRLHKDAARQKKRREKHRNELDREEDRLQRSFKVRGLSTRMLQASRGEVHVRLYEEHASIEQAKENARQMADAFAKRRGADCAQDLQDWSCAKCGRMNSWRDDTCQRVAGTRVSLMDQRESSWAWAAHDECSPNVVRCGHARPEEQGVPTICAPKSRRLIDRWRKNGGKAASKQGRDDVWQDLYQHAFEPATERPVAIDAEEAELTFAPRIDAHSRAIVRERQVVAAVLETLAREDAANDADARTRARAAAEAAYAASLDRRTKDFVENKEAHDRLHADAAARRASRDFHEDPVASGRFPFRPDIGAAAYRPGTSDSQNPRAAQRTLDARLARARPPATAKQSCDFDEDEAGRVPFEPKFTTRGPVQERAPLHAAQTAAAQLRAREIAEARRRRSRSHVNDRSKAYLHNARRNAYADLWRDVVALDQNQPVESAMDAVVRPKRIDATQLGRTPLALAAIDALERKGDGLLDFEQFCRAMDSRIPATGPPTSALFRPKPSSPKDTTAMRQALEDAREFTFTPKLTAQAATSRRHGPSVEAHLRNLGARYEEARRDAEEARASRELEECTFEPRLNARRPPPTLE